MTGSSSEVGSGTSARVLRPAHFIPLLLMIISSAQGQENTQLYLQSSLNASGRNFACPGESVVYSCLIRGDNLFWGVNKESSFLNFPANSGAGSGRTCHRASESCPGSFECYIFSAVLDHITTTNCYSTMTITPGELDANTSELIPCTTNNTQMELNITCRDGSQQNLSTLRTFKFKIADIPHSPTGDCSLNRNEKSVVITLEMPPSRDTDLDYFKVKLYNCSGMSPAKSLEMDIKAPTTIADDGYIKTRFHDVYGENICMNVTTFDKCGQPSSQPLSIMPCSNGAHGQLVGNFLLMVVIPVITWLLSY